MPEYFELSELRARPQLGDADRYPDARCEAAAAWAVSVIEREVGGTSFILRTHTETHDGGTARIVLAEPYARHTAALAITVAGVPVDPALARISSGVLTRATVSGAPAPPWPAGVGTVEISYEAGYTATPPADVKEAALQLTRAHLLDTDSDAWSNPRTTDLSSEIGGTARFGDVDVDHPTGLPAVDRVIVGYRNRLDVFGFA